MTTDITQILLQAQQGAPGAADRLLPLVYEELRQLAAARLAREKPGQTLQATALVHEVYLRLTDVGQKWEGRRHFFAAAAEAMRRILVERARRRRRQKHGGGWQRVALSETIVARDATSEVLAVDAVFDEFAQKHPDRAELVKLRFFVGLTNREAADVLGISTSSADRYWAFARAWLFNALDRRAN
jgi:RNA polymerase sigma factor (TIGR02999 family)